MFDCVMPTRNGRNALAFTSDGPIRLRNAEPPARSGPRRVRLRRATAARNYSRAYLHHLFAADEMLGPTLLSLHNVAFYLRLMARCPGGDRGRDRFAAFHAGCLARWNARFLD